MIGRRILVASLAAMLAACGGSEASVSPATSPVATSLGTPIPSSMTIAASPIPSGTVPLPWMGHTATMLLSGKVLVAGGAADAETVTPIASAELYDPVSNSWTATGSMIEPRSGHVAVLLSTDQVLVLGGSDAARNDLATAELYDPETGTWTATGSMVAPLAWQAVVRLRSGEVLLVGQNHSELYDPGTGAWTLTRPVVNDRGNLSTLTLLADGRVLLAGGGQQEGCAVASAELYDPADGIWKATGSMLDGHAGQAAALLTDGRVLVAGGGCESGTTSELYDPVLGTWSATGTMLVAGGEFTTSQLPDGRVLVLGGSAGGSERLAYAEVCDPTGGAWTALPNMRIARAGHTATLLPSGKVLVVGGDVGGSTASFELYDPSAP